MKSLIFFVFVLCLVAGCKTTDGPAQPVSWERQSAYLSRVRDPRLYGLGIYETPAGIEIRGGGRLHPGQIEKLQMKAKDPVRPVVEVRGEFGRRWPVLLDVTASKSWINFDLAQKLDAIPVGEGDAMLLREAGSEIVRAVSLVPSMRFGQLYIEQPLLQVRMTEDPAGELERGIESPQIKGVIGWDILRRFAQIRFQPDSGDVILVTDEAYQPNPGLLTARLPLVQHAGVCAVYGNIAGRKRMVLIDPAGAFETALPEAVPGGRIELTEDLFVDAVVSGKSSSGIRLGAEWLQQFTITVCPQEGAVYFERVED